MSFFGNKWMLIAITLLSGFAYFKIYGPPKFAQLKLFTSIKPSKIDSAWTVVLKEKEAPFLSSKWKKTLRETAEKLLESGSEKELSAIAKKLYALGFLESVQTRLTDRKTLEIFLKTYKPLFVVTADKQRYLSSTGVVFGDARENYFDASGEDIIQISDLFNERNSSWRLFNESSLILDEKEQVLVNQALNLRVVLRDNNIIAEKIIVDRYRGFSLILRDTNTEVILGSKDFSSRVLRLATVTRNLEKKGVQAERIELDYEGKAFIKERKI